MSVLGPDMSGSGVKIPISKYVASVSDGFPRVGRNRMVEVAVAGRERLDYLPVNLSTDKSIEGSYLEFRVPATEGRFLDLASLALELKLKISTGGANLGADDHACLADAPVNSIFRSVQVYLGDRLIESNALYNYAAYLKLLASFKRSNLDTVGRLGNIAANKDWQTHTYNDVNFPPTEAKARSRLNNLKSEGLHVKFPLGLDIATIDQYLLDGVPMRIRLELASNAWIIGTAKTDADYRLHIADARLWLDRVIPQANALMSLNASLSKPGKVLNYTYNRTLFRTYALAANQDSIVIDLPWGQVIPNKLYIALQDLASYSGDYSRNALYFESGRLERMQVYINSVPIRSLQARHGHEISQLYYDTLDGIGLFSDTLLTYEAFADGKTFFVINFDQEDLENILPVEKSGNLRINLSFGEAVARNRIIYLFGDTVGILSVDRDRTISCDVRA